MGPWVVPTSLTCTTPTNPPVYLAVQPVLLAKCEDAKKRILPVHVRRSPRPVHDDHVRASLDGYDVVSRKNFRQTEENTVASANLAKQKFQRIRKKTKSLSFFFPHSFSSSYLISSSIKETSNHPHAMNTPQFIPRKSYTIAYKLQVIDYVSLAPLHDLSLDTQERRDDEDDE